MDEGSLLLKLVSAIPEIVTGVVVLATILVRITPSKKDDVVVNNFASKVQKALRWLPTLGVNPKTKALEQAYAEAKAKLDALEKK